jgi:DNA end-binding protein Ku
MAARAIWKGYLRLSLVNSAVALYPAVTDTNKVHFHKLNKQTGHRLRMRMVDEETGEEVSRDQQIKGYEISKGENVEIDDEDLDKIALEGTHVIEIEKFVPREEIDPLYFERPYFVAPNDDASVEAFVVLREAMKRKKIGALATVVMHDREHILLIEPRDAGMMATVLRWPYEVRNTKEIFAGIPKKTVSSELLDVAQMLIERKMGSFKPSEFKDRYEEALIELVKAKRSGRKIKAVKPPQPTKSSHVLEALRKSLAESGGKTHARRARSGQSRRPQAKHRRTGAAGKKRA